MTPADPVTFLMAVAPAAAISTGVFAHASKHGSRHATAWDIAAFLFIAAATTGQVNSRLKKEIRQIVESIRFG